MGCSTRRARTPSSNELSRRRIGAAGATGTYRSSLGDGLLPARDDRHHDAQSREGARRDGREHGQRVVAWVRGQLRRAPERWGDQRWNQAPFARSQSAAIVEGTVAARRAEPPSLDALDRATRVSGRRSALVRPTMRLDNAHPQSSIILVADVTIATSAPASLVVELRRGDRSLRAREARTNPCPAWSGA